MPTRTFAVYDVDQFISGLGLTQEEQRSSEEFALQSGLTLREMVRQVLEHEPATLPENCEQLLAALYSLAVDLEQQGRLARNRYRDLVAKRYLSPPEQKELEGLRIELGITKQQPA